MATHSREVLDCVPEARILHLHDGRIMDQGEEPQPGESRPCGSAVSEAADIDPDDPFFPAGGRS